MLLEKKLLENFRRDARCTGYVHVNELQNVLHHPQTNTWSTESS